MSGEATEALAHRLRRWVRAPAGVPDRLPRLWQHPFLGYLVAVLGQVAAVHLTLYLRDVWPRGSRSEYQAVLPLVVVIAVALRWDFGPSVLATLVGAALVNYYVLPPYAAWSRGSMEMDAVLAYVAIGLTIGLLGSRAQRARLQAEAAAQARARLAAIVKASEDAIIGWALDGTITSWNPAAARLYGYRAEEAVGHSIVLLIPPDHRDELPELLARVATRGSDVNYSPHGRWELVLGTGATLPRWSLMSLWSQRCCPASSMSADAPSTQGSPGPDASVPHHVDRGRAPGPGDLGAPAHHAAAGGHAGAHRPRGRRRPPAGAHCGAGGPEPRKRALLARPLGGAAGHPVGRVERSRAAGRRATAGCPSADYGRAGLPGRGAGL